MSHNNHETNTGASRLLFLSSADGNNLSGNPNLTTDFELTLKQPIVVPNHHAILMSLHRASIPHTFYNFQQFRNCGVNIALRKNSDGATADISNLDLDLEPGNYNALDLINVLETQINNWLSGASKSQIGTITSAGVVGNPIPNTANGKGLLFYMRYSRSELKYEWILSRGTNTTNGEKFILIFKWESGADADKSIKDEVGFMENLWIDGITYDYFMNVEINSNGEEFDKYEWGAITNNGQAGSDFYILKSKDTDDFTNKSYKQLTWSGNIRNTTTTTLPIGSVPANTLKATFSAIDVNFHIRSLYIKSNLTQHSVLNSKHGGRFSSILARIPNNVASGETLEIFPRDGINHKLFLKVREIDRIFIRLTDVNNRLINLNGLDWNLSLQFDFIETPDVKHTTPDLRQLTNDNIKKREFEDEERRLRASGKKKELDEFLKIKDTTNFINN